MVLQKRLDYGFNGYQVPPIPRAARSVRKRSIFRKKVNNNQMCAFDLLATVAGELLLEGKNSSNLNDGLIVKEGYEVARGSLKKEELDQVNLMELEKAENAKNDAFSRPTSVITTSDDTKKIAIEPSKAGKDAITSDDTKKIVIEPSKAGNNAISSQNPVVFWERKPTDSVSLDDSVNLALYRNNPIPHCFLPTTGGDDVNLVNNRDDDDDEKPTTLTKGASYRPPPRIGDRRIRKLLASKYWQVTPRPKDDQKPCNTDSEMKSTHRNRKYSYKRQRSQRDYPFKKRKFYACNSVSNSEGMTCSHGNGSSGDVFASGSGGMSAPVTSLQPRDSHHVKKLQIQSFKVPELFIEIPETDTIASLKRTVMEAVSTILGSGLRVGVVFKGKKVRDDGKTLKQSGISLDDNQMDDDTLGFTLEPNNNSASSHVSPRLCPPPEDHRPSLLPCDAPPQPLTRYQPPAPNVVQQGSSDVSKDPPRPAATNLSPPDKSIDDKNTCGGSQALVVVPSMNADSLSLVPITTAATCKSKRCEVVQQQQQRRIRRPFSVSEVEALVQAVEKLGTGRWRDVKIRAFDNAKHRTYVDLKDKWKTLVHTAKISAQQRRGEPVPQELLDRVLTAHAYWSQHQAKQHLKQSSSETRYLL